MNCPTSLHEIIRRVLENDRNGAQRVPLLLDLVPVQCRATRQAMDAVLRLHTTVELLPLWNHFKQQHREPFRGSPLQMALAELAASPKSHEEVMKVVAMIEDKFSLLLSYLYVIPLYPLRKTGICYLFEINGTPMYADKKNEMPVFCLFVGSPQTVMSPPKEKTTTVCVMRITVDEQTMKTEMKIPAQRRWYPPERGDTFELLAAAWLPPSAMADVKPDFFYCLPATVVVVVNTEDA